MRPTWTTETPLVVPARGCLGQVKRLMRGDLHEGEGCRQQGLEPTLPKFRCGQDLAIAKLAEVPEHALNVAPSSTLPCGLYCRRVSWLFLYHRRDPDGTREAALTLASPGATQEVHPGLKLLASSSPSPNGLELPLC